MSNEFNSPSTQGTETPKIKQAYQTLKLREFGAVREFTQGSRGAGNDGGGAQTKNQKSAPEYKTNSVRVGTHPMGFGLYLFDYKPEYAAVFGISGRQFGVMADEVARVLPQAVSKDAAGYTVVDYAMLGIERGDSVLH